MSSAKDPHIPADHLTPPGQGALVTAIFRNYLFLALAYSFSRLLTFLAIVYLARTLGVLGFGKINFAQALLVYFSLLTHLGLMTVGTREIAREPDHVKSQVAHILLLRLVLSAVSFTLLVSFTLIASFPADVEVLVILFGLSLFNGAAILDWVFKGVERMRVVALIEIIRSAPYMVLIFLYVRNPSEIIRIPLLFLLTTGAAALFSIVMFVRFYGWFQLSWNVEIWKGFLRKSMPLGIAFIMGQVYYLLDTILLGFLQGDQSVGLYSSSYRIITFAQGLGVWYFETAFPVLARLYKHSPQDLPRLINASTGLTLLFAIPMAVGTTVLAEPIVVAFYGPQYQAGAHALRILAWAIAVELIGANFGYGLMACDRLKRYLYAVTLGAASSLIINFLLIPRWGIEGASVARLLSEVLITACFFHQFKKLIPIRLEVPAMKLLAAGILMGLALTILKTNWIIQIFIGMVVYLVTVFVIVRHEKNELLVFFKGAWK